MRQLKITKQVTNRETASLDKYLQEIGKVDLITAEEEVELAQRIKAGDQIALEKLTKAKSTLANLLTANTAAACSMQQPTKSVQSLNCSRRHLKKGPLRK